MGGRGGSVRYASYHAHNVRRVLQIPNEVGACAVDIARTESQSLDAARQDRYRMRICQPSKWGPLMTATAAYEEVDAEEDDEKDLCELGRYAESGVSPHRNQGVDQSDGGKQDRRNASHNQGVEEIERDEAAH